MHFPNLAILLLLALVPVTAPASEVLTLPARAGDSAQGHQVAQLPQLRPSALLAETAPEQHSRHSHEPSQQTLRISMWDMIDVIEKRVDDGVEALNADAERLAARAEVARDSPGYAADWLRWRDSLESLRAVHSWSERGEGRLAAEPPRPSSEALEAHFLIEREREAARQGRELHEAQLAEMRETARTERWAIEETVVQESLDRRRASQQHVRGFSISHTVPYSGSWVSPGWIHSNSGCVCSRCRPFVRHHRGIRLGPWNYVERRHDVRPPHRPIVRQATSRLQVGL